MTEFHRARNRGGFTWIEALVVLGIITLLVALLIPAASRSRPAARRTQCKNNLKQIGLALFNYESAFGSFPTGYIHNDEGLYQGWGWSVSLLPYMDQAPLYQTIAFDFGLPHECVKSHLNKPVYSFYCPSDDQWTPQVEHAFVVSSNVKAGIVPSGSIDAKKMFPRTSYFGNAGYLHSEVGGISHDFLGVETAMEMQTNAGSLGHFGTTFSPEHHYCDPQNFQGVFCQNRYLRIEEITDGTSNTIGVGERYVPAKSSPGAIGHGTWLGVPDCSTAAGLAMNLGDTSVKINSGSAKRTQTTGFGSRHVGGSHFLLMDGTVRFISDNIDIGTYRDLSTINDGRQLGDF